MRPLRIDGIALHPVLVHFPVAAWSMAALIAWPALYCPELITYALWSNVIGVAFAPFAMTAGMMELLAVPDSPEVMTAVNRHLLLAVSAFMIYLFMLVLQWKGMLVMSAIAGTFGFILLALAGHAGARLVYIHRLPGGT